jgi:hypothetical protein
MELPGFVDVNRWARQPICSAEPPQAELDDYGRRLKGESYQATLSDTFVEVNARARAPTVRRPRATNFART